mgnify:CR=1 FL=1
MLSYIRIKYLSSFRIITFFTIFLSLLFFFLGVVRFFEIDYFLNFLPKTTREILNESPIWTNYIYLIIVITNLLAIILLLRKKRLTVVVSQYLAVSMIILVLYHFFIMKEIGFFIAIEMLFTIVFYVFFAWFTSYAERKGYLSKISKEKTSVFLKIQEGCDHECAYCPIPIRKGRSRSDTLQNIVANAERMAEEGIKDIVLIGDNIGDFGTGEKGNLKHDHSFLELLMELDKIGDIHRFSFLSVTTPMFSDRTLNFIKKSKRFSPYFSIRMDSASDEILTKMNRPFPLKHYKELFSNIKQIMPDAYIIVEIIVGFPGETDELFNETVQFLSEVDISNIQTTVYSNKIGTKASKITEGIVSDSVCRKREKMLIELSKKKLKTFYEGQLGKEKTVLFEKKRRGDYIYGYTDNHVKVKATWDSKLGNSLHKVKLTGINESFMHFDFIEFKVESKYDNYIQI